MHQRYPMAALVLLGALGGCSQAGDKTSATPSNEPATAIKSAGLAPQRADASPAAMEQPQSGDFSALKGVLTLFASVRGREWSAYSTLDDVDWHDAAPVNYTDAKFARNGSLLLAGFGTVKLPNGKTGLSYALVEGNEGQSGITLSGTGEAVAMFSVEKFYFSENYQDILQRQLDSNVVVARIADRCSSKEYAGIPAHNAFFQLSMLDGKKIFSEAFFEPGGKYSPGYTVFDFYRERPTQRIAELKCKEL